jgi:peroxiredoxin
MRARATFLRRIHHSGCAKAGARLEKLRHLHAVFGLALALSACAPGRAGPATTTLPRTTLINLAGERTELARVAQGRVVLVSLWATWCEACSKEFDALNRLSTGAASRGDALVVGVAVGESRETVDAFVHRHRVHYAQLVDEDFRLADALGQRDVPATLVVDRSGHIVFRGEALDRDALSAFRRTLGEPP